MARDPRIQIDLIGHSNVPGLHRGVYMAVTPPMGLSVAQAVLLGLLVAGYNEVQIGAILGVGMSTMRSRFLKVRDLMGAKDNSHLAVLALERRIVIIAEG